MQSPLQGNDVGALQIGNLVSSFLNGCTTYQAYYYFKTYDDPRPLKALVGAICLLGCVGQICLWESSFWWNVTFSKIGPHTMTLVPAPVSSDVAVIDFSLVILIAQAFFLIRLFKFTGSRALLFCLACVAVTRFTLGAVVGVTGLKVHDLVHLKLNAGHIMTGLWIVGVLFDVSVAAALCRDLYSRKNRFNHDTFKSTASLIDRLIIWCLATGLLASLNTVLLAILFFVFPTKLYWIANWMCLPSLYSNSVLGALNGRRQLRKASAPATRISMQLSIMRRRTFLQSMP